MLSLNHLGLDKQAAGDAAEALREMMILFADLATTPPIARFAG